jgi:hypothetical protein
MAREKLKRKPLAEKFTGSSCRQCGGKYKYTRVTYENTEQHKCVVVCSIACLYEWARSEAKKERDYTPVET